MPDKKSAVPASGVKGLKGSFVRLLRPALDVSDDFAKNACTNVVSSTLSSDEAPCEFGRVWRRVEKNI